MITTSLAMATLVVVLAASAAILAYLPVPFLWIALLWGAMLCILAVRHRSPLLRALWVNLAAVVITLGALELYLYTRETDRMAGSYTEGYYVEHEVLGYSPAAGRESRAIKYHAEELVYDVSYGIDRRGLRVSPPVQGPLVCSSVLFFGGSVMFGEGVEDEQTIPYVTGVMTEGRYAIDNFGFHGYGPHQMLAALELGLVDEMVGELPGYVIYQGIPAHVARAAGRARWDRHGPGYLLDRNGVPVYTGPFDDGQLRPVRWLRKQFDKSAFYRWSGALQRESTPEEIALYIAIVVGGRDAVARKFPGAEFHVLLWGDTGEKTYDAIQDGLHRAGVNVHPVNKILPGYTQDPAGYKLSPFDAHPNPRAYDLIAGYISTHILHGSFCPGAGLLSAGVAE